MTNRHEKSGPSAHAKEQLAASQNQSSTQIQEQDLDPSLSPQAPHGTPSLTVPVHEFRGMFQTLLEVHQQHSYDEYRRGYEQGRRDERAELLAPQIRQTVDSLVNNHRVKQNRRNSAERHRTHIHRNQGAA